MQAVGSNQGSASEGQVQQEQLELLHVTERDEVSVAKSLPKKHVRPRHAAAVCEEQWQ